MKSKISSYLDYTDTPALLIRYPFLLRFVLWLNQILTPRHWYVRRGLKKILSHRTEAFTLLDAGCGYGDFLLLNAKKYPNALFTGIDSADANCAVLRAYCEYKNIRNLIVEQCNLETITVEKHYDAILCCTVLQYIADDERVLKYFFDALSDDGKLLLYIPVNYKRILPFFRMAEKRNDFNYDSAHANHHRYLTEEILKKVVNAGFIIEELSPAYNTIGALGFEISELLMWFIRFSPKILIPLAGLCYLFFLPLCLSMYGIDYLFKNSDGNGLLISATKRKREF